MADVLFLVVRVRVVAKTNLLDRSCLLLALLLLPPLPHVGLDDFYFCVAVLFVLVLVRVFLPVFVFAAKHFGFSTFSFDDDDGDCFLGPVFFVGLYFGYASCCLEFSICVYLATWYGFGDVVVQFDLLRPDDVSRFDFGCVVDDDDFCYGFW